MSNQIWELCPNQGIFFESVHIWFDQDREDVRKNLISLFPEPKGNKKFPDEDDFVAEDGATFIRVRYDGKNRVRDIEFLNGVLRYQNINIHDGAVFQEIEGNFDKIGLSFRATKWLGDGQDCVNLGINIATHENVGGDGDEIEWVILSKDFK